VHYQPYVAVGGNGEAHGIGTVGNKDVEGIVSRAGGKPAAAAVVGMEGTEHVGREVWVEEGQSVGVGRL
jgi:hypothetical protein